MVSFGKSVRGKKQAEALFSFDYKKISNFMILKRD